MKGKGKKELKCMKFARLSSLHSTLPEYCMNDGWHFIRINFHRFKLLFDKNWRIFEWQTVADSNQYAYQTNQSNDNININGNGNGNGNALESIFTWILIKMHWILLLHQVLCAYTLRWCDSQLAIWCYDRFYIKFRPLFLCESLCIFGLLLSNMHIAHASKI